MNDGMFDLLLIVTYIGCGIYCIFSYLKQQKSAELLANKVFCPNNVDPKTCKNPGGYIAYMLPRILILGIGLILFGGLFALEYALGSSGTLAAFLLMSVPLAFLIWYVVVQRKAVKLYWS